MPFKTSAHWIFLLIFIYSCKSDEPATPERNALPPIARFSTEGDLHFVGSAVNFINASAGADRYEWTFGDGNISSEENPSHFYQDEGTYEVRLIVNGPGGADTTELDLLIERAPLEGSTFLSTQEEINAFGAAGYLRVRGSLTINDSLSGSITSINALHDLQIVEGDFSVGYLNGLSSLEGLENLTEVRGNMVLRNIEGITHVDVFENLLIVTKSLFIFSNRDLIEINASDFPKLNSVGEDLFVHRNPNLQSVAGFSIPQSTGRVIIRDNEQLRTINAFERTATALSVDISHNSSLESIDIFRNCTLIDSDLGVSEGIGIQNNPVLQSIDGFSLLTSLDGNLRINDNGSLLHIPTFDSLNRIWGDIEIRRNNQLPSISFVELNRSFGGVFISSNPSLQQIEGFVKLNELGRGGFRSQTSLEVTDNPILNGFNEGAFSAVNWIWGTVNISNNEKLSSFPSLQQVEHIGRDLVISGNQLMTDLTWLERIQSVDLRIYIENNESLTALEGLNQLQSTDRIYINHNQQLDDFCALRNLNSEFWEIEGNFYDPTPEDIRNDNCSQ